MTFEALMGDIVNHPSLDKLQRIIRIDRAQSGSSSVVEHRLAKARVASSNLVSRSTTSDEGGRMKDESPGGFRAAASSFAFHALRSPVRRRSQVVRQRSAKPLFIGSIPIAASSKHSYHQ